MFYSDVISAMIFFLLPLIRPHRYLNSAGCPFRGMLDGGSIAQPVQCDGVAANADYEQKRETGDVTLERADVPAEYRTARRKPEMALPSARAAPSGRAARSPNISCEHMFDTASIDCFERIPLCVQCCN
jgi:hypothetical protein